MSIATTFSILGSFSLGMFVSRGGLIFKRSKLIISYNKFRKTAAKDSRKRRGNREDGNDAGLRDRFLERRRLAKGLGRHRPRRTAQDRSLHADPRSDRAL